MKMINYTTFKPWNLIEYYSKTKDILFVIFALIEYN